MGKLKIEPAEIIKLMHDGMDSLYKARPKHNEKANRASGIGLPCDLHHVRNRLDMHLAIPPDSRLLRIFEIGQNMERNWIAKARGRWRIYDEQQPLEDRELNITGTLEGRIGIRPPRAKTDRILPFEVKSVHPILWEKYQEHEDGWRKFFDNAFHMRWAAQGQTYLHLTNEPWLIMVLLNKSSLAEKYIPMYPDEELIDEIKARAVRVNKYVQTGTYPEPITYNADICGKVCPFRNICFADKVFDPAAILDDPDVLEAAKIAHATKEARDAYKKNWDFLKTKLRGIEHGFLGTDFEFVNKPVEIAPQPERITPAKAGYTQWRLNLRALEGKEEPKPVD